MNILELDSYNLADAVKFNDQLNPRLWGADEHLLPEVREKLLTIADEFREFLGVNDLQLKDMGSLLPGHGGILDRLDSVLLSAPALWLTLELVQRYL